MFEAIIQSLSIWALVFMCILLVRFLVLKSRAVTEPGDQSENIYKGGGKRSFSEVNIMFERKQKMD